MFARLLVAWLTVLLLPVCFVACDRQPSQTGDSDPAQLVTPVRVITPQPVDQVELSAPRSGEVRAAGQVQLAFQVSGQVAAVLVEPGDEVNSGQPLAILDQRMFDAQYEQAAGALSQASSVLAMAEEGARPEEVAILRANVKAALVKLEQARKDHERADELYVEGVIAKQQLDASASAREQLSQALAAAEEQLAIAEAGPREEEIDQARAAVQSATGAVELAATQRDYATLASPSAGTVVLRNLEPGQTVSAGMPVFEIADLANLEIYTEIPEGDLSRIAVGDSARVSFPATPGLTAMATVTSITPKAQPTTRGFPVILELTGDTTGIVTGMVALVSLAYQQAEAGLVIPSRCILDGAVFVAVDGRAERREVELLRDVGERCFVEGLSPGDQVIVNGQHYVEDGGAIKVVDALGVEELTRLDVN